MEFLVTLGTIFIVLCAIMIFLALLSIAATSIYAATQKITNIIEKFFENL